MHIVWEARYGAPSLRRRLCGATRRAVLGNAMNPSPPAEEPSDERFGGPREHDHGPYMTTWYKQWVSSYSRCSCGEYDMSYDPQSESLWGPPPATALPVPVFRAHGSLCRTKPRLLYFHAFGMPGPDRRDVATLEKGERGPYMRTDVGKRRCEKNADWN